MSYEASVKSSNKVTSGVFTIKLIEPYMYWTPKFHKTPVKFRFIVSSKICPMKLVSKAVTKCLKLVYQQNIKYCKAIQNYTGINRMWVANDFMQVSNDIKHINIKQNAKTVETYDFFNSLYNTWTTKFVS